MLRRLIPVGVEPQQGDRIWCRSRYGLFHLTLNKMNSLFRVTCLGKYALNKVYRRIGTPEAGIFLQKFGSLFARVIRVIRSWLGHPLKSIEEVQITPYIPQLQQRSCDRRHAASLPHSAFNNCSLNVVGAHVPYRLNQSIDSLCARHGKRPNLTNSIRLFFAKVRGVFLSLIMHPDNVKAKCPEGFVDCGLDHIARARVIPSTFSIPVLLDCEPMPPRRTRCRL